MKKKIIIVGAQYAGTSLAMAQGDNIETLIPSDPAYFKATTEKLSESIISLTKDINDLNKTYYEPKGSKYHK